MTRMIIPAKVWEKDPIRMLQAKQQPLEAHDKYKINIDSTDSLRHEKTATLSKIIHLWGPDKKLGWLQ